MILNWRYSPILLQKMQFSPTPPLFNTTWWSTWKVTMSRPLRVQNFITGENHLLVPRGSQKFWLHFVPPPYGCGAWPTTKVLYSPTILCCQNCVPVAQVCDCKFMASEKNFCLGGYAVLWAVYPTPSYLSIKLCDLVAKWLGHWSCDQPVAGSNPGLPTVECNPEQVVNTHVPLSQAV